MVNAKLEAQRQTIKHYWLNGAKSAKEIHKITNIPLRTVENNLQKLRAAGTVEHKRGNGRKTKVTQTVARVIGQNIRRNNVLSTLVLFHKYNGWSLLCENIANPTFTCCPKNVSEELAFATGQ